ncbi:MAG: carboxypeptidase regulatory-like domain-containing protein, partial [bacterium]|nr:carboxypeptidase regulatory-like domain-containing protein [bacterium]
VSDSVIPTPDVGLTLRRKVNVNEIDAYSSEWIEYDATALQRNGTLFFEGLAPGYSYELDIFHIGFGSHFERFDVQQNEYKTLNHTFDADDGTGISAQVTVNGQLHEAHLSLHDLTSETKYHGIFAGENGNYTLRNVKPGAYNVRVFISIAPDNCIEKKLPVEVKAGITKALELKY